MKQKKSLCDFIKGKLAYLDPFFAVIDASGVGYKLTISQNTHSLLSRNSSTQDETVTLYTHMSVREDGIELFGFATVEEADAFKMLITVSGVGPKAAISILSQLSPQKLNLAICTEDKKSISQANGIGPKTAARIILELKDKLSKTFTSNSEDIFGEESPVAINTKSNKLSDAQDALMALGYTRSEALNVLKTIDVASLEIDEIIRLALKKIMR